MTFCAFSNFFGIFFGIFRFFAIFSILKAIFSLKIDIFDKKINILLINLSQTAYFDGLTMPNGRKLNGVSMDVNIIFIALIGCSFMPGEGPISVRSGPVRLGPARSGPVRLGPARSGPDTRERITNIDDT